LLTRGDQIKKTTITENFNQEAFNARHAANGVVLFAINPKGVLSIVSGDVPPKAGVGWTLIWLGGAEASVNEGSAPSAVTSAA